MESTAETTTFDTFAIVEIMGHLKLAGRVTEQTVAGQGFIRIDVPETSRQTAYTRLFGPQSIYSITPCTQEVAQAFCDHFTPQPIQTYELCLPDPDNEPF